MARFAAVLGVLALIFGLSTASAKMYFLPDYQNGMYAKRVNVSSNPSSSTPTLRSCDDYPGFISEVEKGDLDCSIIKYVPQVGNCYSDCRCNPDIYKYTSSNCSSLSGTTCTDLDGNVSYSGCDDADPCDTVTAKDCGSYRCKKYYDSCSTKCETCYTDTCDYPENSSYPLESSCDYGCDTRGFITGCNKKCYTCATEPSEGCPTGFATTSNFSTKCLTDIGEAPENGNWLYDVYSPNGTDSSGKACYACKVQCNAGYQPIHEGCYDEAITFVVSTYDNLVTDYNVFDEVTSGSVTLAITTTSSFTIDWGDGTVQTLSSSYPELKKNYSLGLYTIKITGNVTKFSVVGLEGMLPTRVKNLNLPSLKDVSSENACTFKNCSELGGKIPNLPPNLVNGEKLFAGANLQGSFPPLPSTLVNGSRMFGSCSRLSGEITSLPSGMTNANGMFMGTGLTGSVPTLPSGLTDAGYMFYKCGLSGNIPTLPSRLVNAEYMFFNCSGLDGSVPTLPSTITNAKSMFYGCGLSGSIPALPSGLVEGDYMFYLNPSLTGSVPSLPSTLKYASGMFSETGLSGNVPTLPSGLISAARMFENTSGISGTVQNYSTVPNLVDYHNMFYGTNVTKNSTWDEEAWEMAPDSLIQW